MRKVVIKISQGSVVTQTVLGGLTIHLPVINFLQCSRAKNYENWLRVDKVNYCNEKRVQFLAHPVYGAKIRKFSCHAHACAESTSVSCHKRTLP